MKPRRSPRGGHLQFSATTALQSACRSWQSGGGRKSQQCGSSTKRARGSASAPAAALYQEALCEPIGRSTVITMINPMISIHDVSITILDTSNSNQRRRARQKRINRAENKNQLWKPTTLSTTPSAPGAALAR